MTPDTPSAACLSRRAFLTGTGVIVGSALVFGPTSLARPNALTRLAAAGGPRLSVGYVEDSAGLAGADVQALLTAAGTRVTPAASLRSGAKELVGHLASVRIEGLTPDAVSAQAAQLDALLSPPWGAGSEPLPFYAWTMKAGSTAGRPSAFTTAVEAAPSLGLGFRRGAPGQWQESTAVLTGGRDRGLPKLRPGTYLLGFRPDTWTGSRLLPGEDTGAWQPLTSLVVNVAAA